MRPSWTASWTTASSSWAGRSPTSTASSSPEAESEEAVRAMLARDPWSETHLEVDTVDSWTIRLDGRRG
jgi:hypothetical protein